MAELRRMRSEAASELAAASRTRDVQRMAEAILEVERLNAVEHQVLVDAHDRLHTIVLIQEAREQLLQAIQHHNQHHLERKLAHAVELDVEEEVLSQGRQRVRQLVAISEARSALEAAIAGRDYNLLTAALAEAQRLEATTHDSESRANTRLTMLEEINDAENALRALFNSDDSQAVRHALRHARELHCNQDVIDEGEQTRHRISRMKHDLRRDLLEATENGTDRHELQRLINECQRLHAASHRRIEAAEQRLATLR